MSRWRVAQQIIASIKKGDFILRRHAEARLVERQFSKFDVIEIAGTVVRWEWQEEKQTYLFVGTDLDGDGAGFTAIRNKDGTYVITVFKRRIKKWEKKKS
jgi:hypothetical protein